MNLSNPHPPEYSRGLVIRDIYLSMLMQEVHDWELRPGGLVQALEIFERYTKDSLELNNSGLALNEFMQQAVRDLLTATQLEGVEPSNTVVVIM